MKKIVFYISFLFVVSFGFSQTLLNENFSVVPKDIYVGDIVEIQYSFTTNINLLEEQTLELPFPLSTEYEILSSSIYGDNGNYVLKINCIPWNVGALDLPKIDLSQYSETLSTSFAIDIPEVKVLSILERTQNNELRPIKAPLLIPGSTWLIYVLIFFCILLIIAFIYLLFHSKKVISNWNAYRIKQKYKKNLKKTIKCIKKLNKKSAKLSDKDYAKELSEITRDFLSTRFKKNIHSVVSSKISEEINGLFLDSLPENIVEATENISNVLIRLDYVKFSNSQEENAKLSFVERSDISNILIDGFSLIANQRSIEC